VVFDQAVNCVSAFTKKNQNTIKPELERHTAVSQSLGLKGASLRLPFCKQNQVWRVAQEKETPK